MLSADEVVVLRVTRQPADVVAALLEAPPLADSFQTAARRPDKQHGPHVPAALVTLAEETPQLQNEHPRRVTSERVHPDSNGRSQLL